MGKGELTQLSLCAAGETAPTAVPHCCLSQQEDLGAKPSGKDLPGPQTGLLEGGPPASLAGLTDHTAPGMWGPGL